MKSLYVCTYEDGRTPEGNYCEHAAKHSDSTLCACSQVERCDHAFLRESAEQFLRDLDAFETPSGR